MKFMTNIGCRREEIKIPKLKYTLSSKMIRAYKGHEKTH